MVRRLEVRIKVKVGVFAELYERCRASPCGCSVWLGVRAADDEEDEAEGKDGRGDGDGRAQAECREWPACAATIASASASSVRVRCETSGDARLGSESVVEEGGRERARAPPAFAVAASHACIGRTKQPRTGTQTPKRSPWPSETQTERDPRVRTRGRRARESSARKK